MNLKKERRTGMSSYEFIYVKDRTPAVVQKHIYIAEKVLGRRLPIGAVVHHIDGHTRHNINNNLVICQDTSYHLLLHQRARAYKACGEASYLKCQFCQIYDDPKALKIMYKPNGTLNSC